MPPPADGGADRFVEDSDAHTAPPKLTGSHQAVQEYGLMGAGQWFRYLVGTVELAGAIGLLKL